MERNEEKKLKKKTESLTLKTNICSSTKSNSHLLQLDHVLSGQAIFVCVDITVMAFANNSTLYLRLVEHPNDVDLCNSVYRILVVFRSLFDRNKRPDVKAERG